MIILNDVFNHENYLKIFNDRNDTILLSSFSYQIGMAFRIRNYDIDEDDITVQLEMPNDTNKFKWFTFLNLLTAKHNSGQSMLIDSIKDNENDLSRIGSTTFSADIPSRVIGQPNLVEYFASEKDLKRGKRTQIKIGKYIRSRFANMSDERIAEFSNVYTDNNHALEIRFTCSAEKIVEIYGRQSMRSCMTKGEQISHKVDGVLTHCCAVYGDTGHADVFLAYGIRGNKINSRALINMPEKKFNTVYGDISLKRGLKSLGFIRGDLENCNIRKLKTDNGDILMPYIDGENRLVDKGDYFIISCDDDADCQASDIGGLAESYYPENNHDYYCENCDEGIDEESARETRGGFMVCGNCCERNYYYSDWSNQYIDCDSSTYVQMLDANGDFDGEYYIHENDYEDFMDSHVYVEIFDGTMTTDTFNLYSDNENIINN